MKSNIKKNLTNRIIRFVCFVCIVAGGYAQETKLLRQPDINDTQIVYTYGGDIWISEINSSQAKRITSTPAVESNPRFSPDGKWIAFTSNRSGRNAVYLVSSEGGDVKRLTWHPNGALVRGWTNDGQRVLYASTRETAPRPYNRLWTVSTEGGAPDLLSNQWGFNGSYAPDGEQIVIDKMSRWDSEWRAYRGGQNTPLIIMDLKTLEETLLPNDSTTDIHPVWMGDVIYFLSDKSLVSNIWSYDTKTKALNQVTDFKGADIKWLAGHNNKLAYEKDGRLHIMNLLTKTTRTLSINVVGDFPWAETQWKNVTTSARSASLSPNGKRTIMESRGDIFTVPLEFGDTRNITKSSGAADRAPIWSPKGDQIAWFSDVSGTGYQLMVSSQDGLEEPKVYPIGISKMAWNPKWSPDGKYISFVDDDVRLRVLNLETKNIRTIDIGGTNIERGRIQMKWAPDSKWIAYAKTGSNNFRQIFIWSVERNKTTPITDPFADSFSPAWDLNQKHLYFLASTNIALSSGWANTSSITANPAYAAYIINLNKEDASPLKPKSDEEIIKKEEPTKIVIKTSATAPKKEVKIDFENLNRRIFALPIPVRNYSYIITGPKGITFIGERIPNKNNGLRLKRYDLKKKELKDFINSVKQVSITPNGNHMLARINNGWQVFRIAKGNGNSGKKLKPNLQMKLDLTAEWKQMFEEAWRYERDYFYDPNLHGRDWNMVHTRYVQLIPFVKHRSDLNYILDQMNGELSVGHSFVRGGDFPDVPSSSVGLLGADLIADKNRWKIQRIYTTESWNPGLSGPLDAPKLNIKEGYFIVGINGKELTTADNIYEHLDGTAEKQVTLHINSRPSFKDSWKAIVEPIRSENSLRQRTWVEDNRRLVEKLSNGRLGYVWVPNTGGPGFVSFNRYFFAQQDKEGVVIDERFNGGGLLDDYMVDLMTRSLRASITNEVPNGKPFRLPAGILGPKVLLINELAGSGGDFFPWVFRQQKAGKLIGMRTWGGLVKSSTHYALVDGGSLTAPDNAVFDPINNKWIGENEGIAPDIEVRQDAKSLSQDKDPQLERAVNELLNLLPKAKKEIIPPKFSTPATGGKN